MDDRLNRVELKVDKIDERLDSIDKNLAVYNEQLKIHIKRTNLLESEVKPIKDHVTQVRGVFKFLAFLIAASGAALAIASYT